MVFEQYVRLSSARLGILAEGFSDNISKCPSNPTPPLHTAVIVPPRMVPKSAITGEKYSHLKASPLLPHSLPPASSLLSWIVGKLLAFLCPPCVWGIKGAGCHTDICPADMVWMHLCDMDINSLHIHSDYSVAFHAVLLLLRTHQYIQILLTACPIVTVAQLLCM